MFYTFCYAHVPRPPLPSSTDAKALDAGRMCGFGIGAAIRSTSLCPLLVSDVKGGVWFLST